MGIFYEPKKGNIVKYTIFCRGINGDGSSKSKNIIQYIVDLLYKKRSVERNGAIVLYIGCMVPKG
jgi:hypothetical protein